MSDQTQSPDLCPQCRGTGAQPAAPGSSEGYYVPCNACSGTGVAGYEPECTNDAPIDFPPLLCCWRGCLAPATYFLRYEDDEDAHDYPYCDVHADEATDRAFQTGVGVTSALIAVAQADGGDDDDPTDPIPYDDDTDPDLPPLPPAQPEPDACAPGACEAAR